MNHLQRRIERAETALGMAQPEIVVNIMHFSNGPLPPEERQGNIIIRHIPYEREPKKCEIMPDDSRPSNGS